MLILAHDPRFPDHPMDRSDTPRDHEACRFSWWFSCSFTTTMTVRGKKVKEQCPRRHRVHCDGGTHVPLEIAIAALEQAGWRQADDGSWRCPQHRTS